jgi:hypothetical protein
MAMILSVVCFVPALAIAALSRVKGDSSGYWISGLLLAGIMLTWIAAARGELNPRPRRRAGGGGYHYGYNYDPGAIHD